MGQPGNNGYISSRSLVCLDTKRPFEHHVMLVPSALSSQNPLASREPYELPACYADREEFDDDPDLSERRSLLTSQIQQYDPHFVFPHDLSISNSMVFDLKALIAAHSFPSNTFTQSTPYCAMLDPVDSSLASSRSSYLTPHGSSQSFYSSADLKDRVHTIGHVQGFDTELGLPMGGDLPGHQPDSCDFGERITVAIESLYDLPGVDPRSGSSCTVDSRTSGLSNSVQSSSVMESLVSEMPGSSRDSTASPSKLDSTVQSPENSDTDHKHQGTKRRKVQQKRVVCVPLAGDGKQKIQAPPSDDWAWRKYGQKPIKGSPYPRGYYRCSSSKGCSARKQVERSRSDPSMLLITYTSDHNHSWPAQRNSSAGVANRPESSLETDSNPKHEAAAAADCEPLENLFSSIINSPDTRDEHMMPSFESIHADQESFSLDKAADQLCSSLRPHSEEEDFFDELGELPELAAIFRTGFLDERSCQEIVGTNVDSYSILGWSSNPFLESKVVC